MSENKGKSGPKNGRTNLFGEPAEEAGPKTKEIRGYPFGMVASALQKEIRRGDERAAVYWALLLAEAAPWYAWKRILITAAEDIGLAAAAVVDQVINLALAWRLCKDRSWYVSPHHITMAVMLLCRAPKSTDAEDLQSLTLEQITRNERRPVLREYEDAHTDAGRARKASVADWFDDRLFTLRVPVSHYLKELLAYKPDWCSERMKQALEHLEPGDLPEDGRAG